MTPLEIYESILPYKPYCSNEKAYPRIRTKELAARMPYLNPNFPAMSYLAFDVDYEIPPLKMRCIPRPTFQIFNRDNGHSHVLYRMTKPLPLKMSYKLLNYYKDVSFGLLVLLMADQQLNHTKALIKNPLCDVWETISSNASYTLSDLKEYIPDDIERPDQDDQVRDHQDRELYDVFESACINYNHSRNCAMFHYLRSRAYKLIQTKSDLFNALIDEGLQANEKIPLYFSKRPLNYAEIKSICRSIARWCNNHKGMIKGINVASGAMNLQKIRNLSPDEFKQEVKARQSLAAARTTRIKRSDTERKIIEAIVSLQDQGTKITYKNVAIRSGLDQRTVSNYEHVFCRYVSK